MRLEQACEADYPAIVQLANMAYRGSEEAKGWTTESSYIEGPRLTLSQLQQDLKLKPAAQLLKLHETDGLILLGTVWLEPKTHDTWYLGLLTIRPDQQARQLGRGLLAAAEAYAVKRGARTMRMTVVNVRETLIAWYERRGYGRTGESEPFPYGDNRFGTPLRPDLSFIVLEKRLTAAEPVMHRPTA